MVGALPDAVTDAVSAMLAAAIPGAELADPLGPIGSADPANSPGVASFTAPQVTDSSSANGSETAS